MISLKKFSGSVVIIVGALLIVFELGTCMSEPHLIRDPMNALAFVAMMVIGILFIFAGRKLMIRIKKE